MLEELRQCLQALQKTAGIDGDPGLLPLGLPAVDGVLGGGLLRGALHEIAAVSEAHLAAATGFALGLAALRGQTRALVWIAEDMALIESGAPYGPGLDAFGLAPERLLTVSVTHRRDLMGAMEEALRCRAVGAVIGEVRHDALDAVAVRRLSLATAESGALAFLLRARPQRDASTAATRWIVGATPSSTTSRQFEFGPPRFAAQLIRNRRGPTASWIFEWSDDDECFVRATPALPVAAAPADRPRRAIA
jgi:protein ImuA